MSKWRPDGWQNPFAETDDFGMYKIPLGEDNITNKRTCFEAGADAMLEALKETGLATPIGHWVEAVARGESSNTLAIPYDEKGWLVFIPEE